MLARGSKNLEVKKLQHNLKDLGFNPGSENGFYDTRTEEAVMFFQKHHNLKISGIVDEDTEKMILDLMKEYEQNNLLHQ